MDSQTLKERYDLKAQFLKEFPLDSLKTMPIEKYTNHNKNSFCYWLEFITPDLGQIGGTPSYQFKIFEYKSKPKHIGGKFSCDNKYAWLSQMGKDHLSVYEKVRSRIWEIADYASRGELSKIDKVALGDMVKWKIAFLYSTSGIVPIYSKKMLADFAEKYGMTKASKKPISELQTFLFKAKGEEDIFSFADRLCSKDSKLPSALGSKSTKELGFYDLVTNALKDKKNIILQGAPGTGKTYAIPEIVTRLCEENIDFNIRKDVMESFNRLIKESRVMFTTFHQSMDYEDFVEGLKPVKDENNNVFYKVEPGIFKRICIEASKPVIQNNSINLNPNATIWKVSLSKAGPNKDRTECLQNGHIRIGWDEYGENYEDQSEYKDGGKSILDAFYNKMIEGDIVLSCFSNKTIDAIGIVTGEPEWHPNYQHLKRLRTVRWLVKGITEDIFVITGKVMVQSAVYKMNDITIENVLDILKKHGASGNTFYESNKKPYVLVIDEINRGNVPKIFGELITLLEADKRSDGIMPIKVKLQYSQDEYFEMPPNLYIIATMNTADRSLNHFDYAMRRRFRFVTMAYNLVDLKLAPEMIFHEDLFEKVSKLFILNYDDYKKDNKTQIIPAACFSLEFKPIDLWIGPSYFITNKNKLDAIRNNIIYEIIPTLENYLDDGVFVDRTPVLSVIDELRKIAFEVE